MYWKDTKLLRDETLSLQKTCDMMEIKESCRHILEKFFRIEQELELENKLLRKSRIRRGAINIIGNIANSLFGILDSEYAEQMSATIKNMKTDDSVMLRLLRDQTSVITSTLNVVKQSMTTTKHNFGQMEKKLNEISKREHAISDEMYQMKLSQYFNLNTMQLSLIADRIQGMQTCMLDVLTDVHHGKINPLLLTPDQLQAEIEQIKIHMPHYLKLPVTDDDILQMYKLMKIKGGLTEDHVVFTISLPLVELDDFKLYHLIPVPTRVGDSLSVINICSSMLAVNLDQQQYFPVSTLNLQKCDVLRQDLFICSDIQLKFNFGAEICSCEISLFQNVTKPDCNLKTLQTNVSWVPLTHQNQWMYATLSITQATAVCEKNIIPLQLEGSGILTLQQNCLLKHGPIHVSGQQTLSSTLKSSYTSLGSVTDLVVKHNMVNDNDTKANQPLDQLDSHLAELSSIQKKLQAIENTRNEHHRSYQHSISISYAALCIGGIIFTLISCRCLISKRPCRRNSPSPESSNSRPIPTPRHNFAIHV
ncbi:uncharacterized protein LOC142236813 [Haematobia irritans]|uniref:uncharacterized protein LOC142236813 n=1 Tax=Haematobia irritans TaxID=7368 RepID=UPI003F4FDEEA